MKNIAQLSRYIRFQLSQLKSQNRYHEFEHLCRHFARLRICDRLLPATGPVGQGGDLGRDFESYRSYLSTTSLDNSFALAIANGEKLVFACSLQAKIGKKIRADVKTVCSGPDHIDAVYYFSETDIPVGVRQALQAWAKKSFDVGLEILDGQAISEELATPELFWIAEEFLSVSADQYPRLPKSDSRYGKFKARWFGGERVPENFADFFEIKYGLREATFTKEHKPDLTQWISLIDRFTGPQEPSQLQRKAKYEICVAALRGQNNLDKYREYIAAYFASIDKLEDAADLLDAVTLLSYCSTAQCIGHLHAEIPQLHAWTKQLVARLTYLLSQTSAPGLRCSLLQSLGTASRLQFRKGLEPELDTEDLFKYWGMLAEEVAYAPLFPLEQLADLLTILAPHLGDDPRFQDLTRRIDELLEDRTGGFVAAEKCRDRAVAHLDAGQIIPSIKQLHTARIKWFSAETLRGSVLAMLTLADCYSRLGLGFAAAYYALGAVIVTFRSQDDSLKKLLARSSFIAADHFYSVGASITYLQVLTLAFFGHGTYVDDPGDVERHEGIQRAMSHTVILRALGRRFNQEIVRIIDKIIDEWPIDSDWIQAPSLETWGALGGLSGSRWGCAGLFPTRMRMNAH